MTDIKSMTDEELAVRYVEGDNSAFDELLRRNQSKIFTYIMFIVKDEELANDIFQNTFIKVIVSLQEGRYVPSGKFFYWLTRIAHNVIMDCYRAQRSEHIVEPTSDNDLSNLNENSMQDTYVEAEMVRDQTMQDLRRMVASLSPAQREVVYMHYYQGMPFREIAKVTGVSINTALGRMRYALINLRKMADKYDIVLDAEG